MWIHSSNQLINYTELYIELKCNLNLSEYKVDVKVVVLLY